MGSFCLDVTMTLGIWAYQHFSKRTARMLTIVKCRHGLHPENHPSHRFSTAKPWGKDDIGTWKRDQWEGSERV